MKDARPSIPGIDLGALRQTAGRLETYDAVDRGSRAPVVVSIIAPGDDDYLELVIAHQRAVQGVQSPHVQRVLDTGITRSGLGYVIAEAVDGNPMSDTPDDTAFEQLTEVAAAARVFHDHGLAHGAIDPDHVVVRPDGSIVLTMAGLAGYVEGAATPFQPVEQALRPRPEVADDIHALGVLGWWLQTGRTPDQPGSLGAPDHVEAALRRAVEPDADNRQWTVEEFLFELEHDDDHRGGYVAAGAEPTELPPAALTIRKLPVLLGAGAVVALLFMAFTTFRPDRAEISTEVLGVTTVPTTEASTTTTTSPRRAPSTTDPATAEAGADDAGAGVVGDDTTASTAVVAGQPAPAGPRVTTAPTRTPTTTAPPRTTTAPPTTVLIVPPTITSLPTLTVPPTT